MVPAPLRGALNMTEIFWRDHYLWLKERGYQLRPRYSPDWVPSWHGTKKYFMDCEDGRSLGFTQVNDAIHLPTGRHVALKKVYKTVNPFEEDITRLFSSEPLTKDPRNHCVPLLDVLQLPSNETEEEEVSLFVLPFLRVFNSPIFDTFGEALDCIRQLFEGLQFMHENHVAHRDINYTNFMMEPETMFPDGYHPKEILRKPDLSGKAKFYTRTQNPPRYHLIDFGLSRQYDASDVSPLEPVILGGDDTVPEFKEPEKPQNPFQTDVYCAGNLVRTQFIEGHPVLTSFRGYRGFEFLKPLIDDMVQDDPTKRPKMDDVLRRFDDVVKGLSAWKLRSRTSSRRANIFQDIKHSFWHWRRKFTFIIKRTAAIPHP
ncbi:hypothetical protein GALMADRAFT_74620 [Galerina marginata CBS 339.88]|uniref:Protein kinase domain-containing protein n=1 Tax=Galerina marginata (strain CBS 339.88) TaxID=685588 RepID=A0A067SYD5_GALM3|nr:hypothetical protein GALMADRAFT_74620 [Galerina marginata CBS 339.88]